jgi:hypothetical protein
LVEKTLQDGNRFCQDARDRYLISGGVSRSF